MNTYLIYHEDGYLLDDIVADSYEEMEEMVAEGLWDNELKLSEIRNATVHMILDASLKDLVNRVSVEMLEEINDNKAGKCESISTEESLRRDLTSVVTNHIHNFKKIVVDVDYKK